MVTCMAGKLSSLVCVHDEGDGPQRHAIAVHTGLSGLEIKEMRAQPKTSTMGPFLTYPWLLIQGSVLFCTGDGDI